MPSRYFYNVVSGHGGSTLHGTTTTKKEAEQIKRDAKERGYDYVRIVRKSISADVDFLHGGIQKRKKNPHSRRKPSLRATPRDRTGWIPVRAVKFEKGKLLLKTSKSVARGLRAGKRLGNPRTGDLEIEIVASGNQFYKAVDTLKRSGAKYKSDTKTWVLPRDKWYQLYGSKSRFSVVSGNEPIFDAISKEWI